LHAAFTRKDKRHARKIISELTLKGKSHEKIEISKGLFVGAKTPECLLSLCGLNNAVCQNDRINLLIDLIEKKKNVPDDILKKLIIEEIEILCEERVCKRIAS
jgi:hypothetical protein